MNKIKTWLMGGVLALSFGALTACTTPTENVNPTESTEQYEISDINCNYETGDNFSIDGAKLKIFNGISYDTVTLDVSMLRSMPDLTTTGEKQVEIVYNNKIYKFTIHVSLNKQIKNEQYIQKLQKALEDVRSFKASSVTGKIDVDLETSYMANGYPINKSLNYVINSKDVENITSYFENNAYHAVIRSILEGCYNINSENVVNPDNNLTKYNYGNLLNSLKQNIVNEQMLKYVLADAVSSLGSAESVNSYLCNALQITGKANIVKSLNYVNNLIDAVLNLDYDSMGENLLLYMGFCKDNTVRPYCMYFAGAEAVIMQILQNPDGNNSKHALSECLKDMSEAIYDLDIKRGYVSEDIVEKDRSVFNDFYKIIENVEDLAGGVITTQECVVAVINNVCALILNQNFQELFVAPHGSQYVEIYESLKAVCNLITTADVEQLINDENYLIDVLLEDSDFVEKLSYVMDNIVYQSIKDKLSDNTFENVMDLIDVKFTKALIEKIKDKTIQLNDVASCYVETILDIDSQGLFNDDVVTTIMVKICSDYKKGDKSFANLRAELVANKSSYIPSIASMIAQGLVTEDNQTAIQNYTNDFEDALNDIFENELIKSENEFNVHEVMNQLYVFATTHTDNILLNSMIVGLETELYLFGYYDNNVTYKDVLRRIKDNLIDNLAENTSYGVFAKAFVIALLTDGVNVQSYLGSILSDDIVYENVQMAINSLVLEGLHQLDSSIDVSNTSFVNDNFTVVILNAIKNGNYNTDVYNNAIKAVVNEYKTVFTNWFANCVSNGQNIIKQGVTVEQFKEATSQILLDLINDAISGNSFNAKNWETKFNNYCETYLNNVLTDGIYNVITLIYAGISLKDAQIENCEDVYNYFLDSLQNDYIYNYISNAITNSVMFALYKQNNSIDVTDSSYVKTNFSNKILDAIKDNKLDASLVSDCVQDILDVYLNTYDDRVLNVVEIIAGLQENPESATELLSLYKNEIASFIACNMLEQLNVRNLKLTPEEFTQKTKELVCEFIDDVCAKTVDTKTWLNKLYNYSTLYLDESAQTVLFSSFALIAVISYDSSINYNELFSFVELPNGVVVDYNTLLAKLANINISEIIRLSNVQSNVVLDENNNAVKNTIFFTISINFNAMIASINGDVTFSVIVE